MCVFSFSRFKKSLLLPPLGFPLGKNCKSPRKRYYDPGDRNWNPGREGETGDPTSETNLVLLPHQQPSVRKRSGLSQRPHRAGWQHTPLASQPPSAVTDFFFPWQRRPSEREAFHLKFTKVEFKSRLFLYSLSQHQQFQHIKC